ncbi:arginase family protein [Actinomadura darangshiensis]|uniref:Arginase family protein n=1 Tax=Actinomadura darangshiensis TaxID=705336 RepID=A0A4R5B5D1_9ACTN|nr:arginase family protein [Actinomadura darangshiensis]TDD81031.1 arginase family protein [Actinomadura darangshiensis]
MTVTLVPYHQDERLPESSFPLPGGDVVPVTRELPEGDVWQRVAALFEPVSAEVADQVNGGSRPVVVSGDCLTSEAVLAGVQRAGVDASIVWFDAHGDVHTVESSTSGYIGGMPLRQILGADSGLLADPLGLRPLPEDRAVLVGARDIDPAEAVFLASSQVRRCGVDDVVLPDGPLVLHIDVDVIDAADLPGLRFPVGGGPSREAVVDSVRRIMATGRVAALDIACPWHPPEGDDDAIRARLLADLLGA